MIILFLLIHSWYPQACCGSNHCRPVACATMVTHADGSADWTGLHFFPAQVHASQDGMCHVCVSYGEHNHGRVALCAFIASTT